MPWSEDGYFLRQFSSGSTGRPKHLLKTEANLFREGEFLRRAYNLGDHEVFFVIAPLHHSAGMESFHLAFHCGATILAMPQFIPGALIDAARRERPTVMIGTPPVFDALASCLLLPEDRSVLHTLKICLCGAGRLSRNSHDEFVERFGIPLTVRFGSSETLGITFDSDEGFVEGRVGRPNPEVEVVVLDEDGNACPTGTAGQIGIRSPATSSRYEGDPEASAKTFRNGWVFLGDVGKFDDSGNLHLIGRSDIISIGGHKVDKLEVERVIRDALPVTDVVVMEASSAGLPVVRAVIQADPDQVTKAMVVAACRKSLSSYKVPRIVEIRMTFERNAIGKVKASSFENPE
jgi:long-chain acyl-CoA synthetase